MSETEGINSIKVGNAVAYYATERWEGESSEISIEERIIMAATDHWEGRFLGGIKDMSVVYSHDDKELKRGDEIQLVVTGTGIRLTRLVGVASGSKFDEVPAGLFDEQRKTNEYGGEVKTVDLNKDGFDGTTALLSAELGERFAVPAVEKGLGNFDTHAPDLQDSNTEWKFEVEDGVPRLLVAGIGARLLRPWKNAVYLKNVEVIDIDLSEGGEEEEDKESLLDDTDMDIDVSEETRSETIEFEDLHDE